MTTQLETKPKEPALIEIRASSLPGSTDCFRRWAVQTATSKANKGSLLPIFHRHGFFPSERTSNHIGSAIGTACHKGIEAVLKWRMEATEDSIPDPVEIAKKELLSIPNIGFDPKTTPNIETAEFQMSRMVQSYLPHALTLKPARMEFFLSARPDPLKRFLLTGHPDIQEVNGDIRDMKFGKTCGPYEAQVGSYRLMSRTHNLPVGRLFADWVKRGAKTKPQPAPEIIEYNPQSCEDAAYFLSEHLMSMLEKFIETGNVWAFPTNNNSNLCSKKWCQAWGTPMCDMGRPEKTDKSED